MEYDAIVIGAGVAGLFAAYNLSQQGKRVLVLEAASQVGGYATTFSRKGFTFESSLHTVGGLGRGGAIRKFLEEEGLTEGVEFLEAEEFLRSIYPDRDFVIDAQGALSTPRLKGYFPAQGKNIDAFIKAFKRFYREFDTFSESWLPQWCKIAVMPLFFRNLMRASKMTAGEFIRRYIKDEELVSVLTDLWGFVGLPPGKVSAVYFLLVFDSCYTSPATQIKGGFSQLLKLVARRIESSGGKILLNTRVERILTLEGKAVKGVVTAKQEEFQAGVVISNISPFLALGELLEEEGLRQKYRQQLSAYEKSISCFQLYLGLKRPAASLGMTHSLISISPSYGHDQHYSACLEGDFQNCQFMLTDLARLDPGLTPAGKGSLIIIALDAYANWKGLSEESYKAKKEQVAATLIQRAEKYLPGLSQAIELVETASPLTMERYTGSSAGAMYGLAQSLEQAGMNRLPQTTDIKGLFLAGAWTFPGGGVYGCFVSGLLAGELARNFYKTSSK